MSWRKTEFGCVGESEGSAPAELLVAILPDTDTPGTLVRAAVEFWARSLPSADFIVFNRASTAGLIEGVLSQFLKSAGMTPGRLLLVGLSGSAAVGLSAMLGSVEPVRAGVVAYDAIPLQMSDLPRAARGIRIRLIGCRGDGCGDEDLFVRTIRDLSAFGVDIRGTLLVEPGLTPAAIRIGGAYLSELSASALDVPRGPPTTPTGAFDGSSP